MKIWSEKGTIFNKKKYYMAFGNTKARKTIDSVWRSWGWTNQDNALGPWGYGSTLWNSVWRPKVTPQENLAVPSNLPCLGKFTSQSQ